MSLFCEICRLPKINSTLIVPNFVPKGNYTTLPTTAMNKSYSIDFTKSIALSNVLNSAKSACEFRLLGLGRENFREL